MTERAAIQIMTWFPAETGGALVNGTLVVIVAKMVTGVAGLVVVRMGSGKGNLCISSSPPRFEPLKDSFFFRCNEGGRGQDVRGGGGLGG